MAQSLEAIGDLHFGEYPLRPPGATFVPFDYGDSRFNILSVAGLFPAKQAPHGRVLWGLCASI